MRYKRHCLFNIVNENYIYFIKGQRPNGTHLNDMVHYVVPGRAKKIGGSPSDKENDNASIRKDMDETENETNDLKVYVSTPNGLKRVVERTNSQASSNSKYVFHLFCQNMCVTVIL